MKQLLKKIVFLFPANIREIFFYAHFFEHPIKKIKQLIMFSKEKKQFIDKNIYYSLKKLIFKTNNGYEFIKKYINCELEIIRLNNINSQDIILICLVKNDLVRIKEFYKHYSNIGINQFVFIDNYSNDGTFEYLKSKKNVSIFRTREKYSTLNRQVWIYKVMNEYGYNNTFLIVDSDEFLIYPDYEKKKINDYLNEKKEDRYRALMLDMYSDQNFLCNDRNLEKSFREKYCYFDKCGYYAMNDLRFDSIIGGVRQRVFKEYESISPYLTKYPLIKYDIGDVFYNSHFYLPYFKNFNCDIQFILLHYKFLPSDIDRIKKRVKENNYAKNSIEYRAYLKAYKNNPNLKFVNSNSEKLKSSNDLYKLDFIKNESNKVI